MKAFCYWDAKSLPDTCIVFFNLTITLILFTFAAYNIFKHIRYFSGKIVRIYGLIILWGLFTICQFLYSIIIYFAYVKKQQHKQIPQWSKAYCLIDAIPGFIIQSLFLSICYIMLSNIRQIAISMNLKLSFMGKSGFTVFRIYIVIRLVAYMSAYFATVFADPFNDQIKYANYSKILVLLADSLISSLILLSCFQTISKTLDQISVIQSNQQKLKLKIQYGMMIAASSVRFATDLFFLLYLPTSGGIDESFCIDPFPDHLRFSIGYLIFGNLLGHFLPIALILKFYQFKQEQSISGSLLEKQKYLTSQ